MEGSDETIFKLLKVFNDEFEVALRKARGSEGVEQLGERR